MKQSIRKTLSATGIGLLTGLAISLGVEANATSQPQSIPLEDLHRFTSVVEHVRSYYVNETEDQQLFENAIRGMLSGLDPYSSFYTPDEYSELREGTSGEFGGLGIEVTMEEGFIRVVSPIDGTPAESAGIQAGDLIFKLDDTPVRGMTLKAAVDIMRGVPGTPITLGIIREGEDKPVSVEVVRDIIMVESVKAKLLAPQFGYIRVSQFQSQTGDDFRDAVHELIDQADDQTLKGLVLDLRNNPGGIFEASVAVSDAFLDAKKLKHDRLVVYAQGRLPGSELREKAHNGDILKGAPIVVLVNGGSASASEIVAGALQDHQRAVIMGTQTFGKGSVQTVLPLDEDFGLKLTTALYYTPSGRSIQATGITPDIEVQLLPMPEREDKMANLASIREQDLKGHLNNPLVQSIIGESEEDVAESPQFEPITDYQVFEALNLLKGLSILEG